MSSVASSASSFGRAFALFVSALLAGASLHAEKLVTVKSVADAQYIARRAAINPSPTETYVFAKGTFFTGCAQDNTLERMPFMRIAETLAHDLRRQNYYPTQDLKSADLVIVVHWGVTLPNDNDASLVSLDPNILSDAITAIGEAQELEAADTFEGQTARALGAVAAAEASLRRNASDLVDLHKRGQRGGQSNAELLGFTDAIYEESKTTLIVESETARALREMVNEERYFIIMVAYDGPALRAGKKQRLWTSRMSIRAAGVNFIMALDRMSNAGAKFHGTRQEALRLEYQGGRRGTVKIGDLKVINDSTPAKP
jgi:hypothetical protein